MSGDSLLETLRAIVREFFPRYDFLGRYRYRVVVMEGETASLQAVAKHPGLPDLPSVPVAAGMAGLFAELAPSAIVLVEFIEGDPRLPIITGFSRDGGSNFYPLTLTIEAQAQIRLGASAAQGVARAGDTVTVLLPPAMFTGTIGGSPAAGMVVWAPGQTTGTITTSSAKVVSE